MNSNRVLWSEGMFLRPQHFQQLERSIDRRIAACVDGIPHTQWGFTTLRLDAAALRIGRVAISIARGRFPDGTPFDIPAEQPAPPPFEPATFGPAPGTGACTVCLTLPLARAGVPEFSFTGAGAARTDPSARFVGDVQRVGDAVAGHPESVEVTLAQPHLRLIAAGAIPSDRCVLAVAQVLEHPAGGALVLDEQHIPPVLDGRAAPRLVQLATECLQWLRHRAAALAARLMPLAHARSGDLADRQLLQLVNRVDAELTWLIERAHHPEALHGLLARAVAELATFSDERCHRPRAVQAYRHDALQASFEPLTSELRALLAEIADPVALALALQARAPGLYTAEAPDVALLRQAEFVLAVRAETGAEIVRQRFPSQAKLGPPDRIRDLVRLHLPAIALEPLPSAPSRVPVLAGFTYFRLDRHSALWSALEASRVLALHVAGDFPALELQLWAIRPGDEGRRA